MAEYDPQRSRPRRRVTDDAGPAPIDELLDAAPDRAATPDRPAVPTAPREPSRNGGAARPSTAEVVDLAPAPPVAVETSSRRARVLLVLIVVALALTGFLVRRLGAARRARRS
jgi:hypothetical protein